MSRNTFATISPRALRHNLERVRLLSGDARVMAAVKADAYGHVLERCLPALAGVDMLAVATMDEARAIRTLDPCAPVLLLEGVMAAEELEAVERLNLEMVVHHRSQLEWIEARGGVSGPRIWLKLDSGMHRLGFPPADASGIHARLSALDGVEQIVLMSHFACADRADHPLNQRQIERFDAAVSGLAGPQCLANSAALLNLPQTRRDWVRAGLLLYGVSPIAGRPGAALGLQPSMTLETRLIAINDIPAGETIGYGARFTAPREMRIGVAAIGYGDGYPRNMPDGAPVLVNGREQKLAGRVSMDMITIDLDGQEQARVGDPVVLWGQGLAVERVAETVGTIPYELLCRVTRRVAYREG
ncbi:MAG: alanine racemase [Wenzhouxiangellaceae bacterium]